MLYNIKTNGNSLILCVHKNYLHMKTKLNYCIIIFSTVLIKNCLFNKMTSYVSPERMRIQLCHKFDEYVTSFPIVIEHILRIKSQL